jgi:hypothetical protein
MRNYSLERRTACANLDRLEKPDCNRLLTNPRFVSGYDYSICKRFGTVRL